MNPEEYCKSCKYIQCFMRGLIDRTLQCQRERDDYVKWNDIQKGKERDEMNEYKINNYEDRKNVIIAFVNAGFKVSVIQRVSEHRALHTVYDYYVVIE